MNRRWIVLGTCVLVVVAVMLLAPNLVSLRFEPGKPLALAADPARRIILPPLSISEDTPLWKILLLWAALVVDLALFLLLLSPELRKRILRQVIRFALGVLAIILMLRYHVLQLPAVLTAPDTGGPSAIAAPGVPLDAPVFQPPQLAPWFIYVISIASLWLMLVGLYLVYNAWRRYSMRKLSTMGAIADIARESLSELTAGRQWSDVVVKAYARMNDVVRVSRGLNREVSSTPREFAVRLARTGLPSTSIEELTRLFESVRYGGRASDDGAAKRAAACLESILQACGAAA